MSDIAFLLIIFFMVTTVFNKDQGLDLKLPEITKPEILDQMVAHVTIPHGSDGSIIHFEGKPVHVEVLSLEIMQKMAGNPNFYVVLKADESIPYYIIKDVMDNVQKGFVNKIALAVDFRK